MFTARYGLGVYIQFRLISEFKVLNLYFSLSLIPRLHFAVSLITPFISPSREVTSRYDGSTLVCAPYITFSLSFPHSPSLNSKPWSYCFTTQSHYNLALYFCVIFLSLLHLLRLYIYFRRKLCIVAGNMNWGLNKRENVWEALWKYGGKKIQACCSDVLVLVVSAVMCWCL